MCGLLCSLCCVFRLYSEAELQTLPGVSKAVAAPAHGAVLVAPPPPAKDPPYACELLRPPVKQPPSVKEPPGFKAASWDPYQTLNEEAESAFLPAVGGGTAEAVLKRALPKPLAPHQTSNEGAMCVCACVSV